MTQWIRAILPVTRFADFELEKDDCADAQVLEAQINISNCPEHTRVQTSIKTDNLESLLFIRYNFERLKLPSVESDTEELEAENLNGFSILTLIKFKFCHYTGFHVSAGSNLLLEVLDPAKSTPIYLLCWKIPETNLKGDPLGKISKTIDNFTQSHSPKKLKNL